MESGQTPAIISIKHQNKGASLSLFSAVREGGSVLQSTLCRLAHDICLAHHLMVLQLQSKEDSSVRLGEPRDPVRQPTFFRLVSAVHHGVLGTSSALAAACFLLFVLALCEASRPILPLHESAIAETPVLHDAILPLNVSTAVHITPQPALQSFSHIDTAKYELAAHVTPRALLERDCHTSDVKQFEVSGVGLPTFQVEISNTCTNPLCSISFVIVHCGLFHSGDILVNLKVLRRLAILHGTCIVNDGQQIRNADTIIFQYKEIWEQPIKARVFCHG